MNSIKRSCRKVEKGNDGWTPFAAFVGVARKSNFSIYRIKKMLTSQSNGLGRRNQFI
ncbi:MAG: hypothetical protein Q7S43_02255 [bacterium]|nr:hypothetical protein [bacterium]